MNNIVNSVAYRSGARIGEVEIEAISDVIQEPGAFVWLGLHEPPLPLLRKIQEEFGLHDLSIEDAQTGHQRPKIEEYGDSLFIVLHTAQWWNNEVEVGETHFFLGKNFLISIRQGTTQHYSQVRSRCEGMPNRLAMGPGFALYGIMDFIVDNYQPMVDEFEQRLERIEADIFRDRFDRNTIERLYDLRRQLQELVNASEPVIEICGELMRLHNKLIPAELHPYLRDVRDHATRATRAAENLRARVTDAMQVNVALMAVRQNEVVKVLAGWAAILAIPTMVFSMYGMNFKFMPELDWPFSYPLALAATGAGCYFLYRRLKRTGWL
jgi:magnesium transporter